MRLIHFILVLVIATLLVSCGGKTGGKHGSADVDLSQVPDSLLPIQAPEPIDTTPDSQDLIDEAYAAGDIDDGKYYALKLRADVAPDTLPAEYQSDAVGRDDSLMIQLAIEHWDELSPEDQEELRPYTLSPMNPESYWYDPGDTYEGAGEQTSESWFGAVDRFLDWVTVIPAAAAVKHPHSSGNGFMISTTNTQKFKIVAAALEKAHKKYEDEMGMTEPTEWIIVKMLDLPAPPGKKTYGRAFMADFENKRRCNILIDKDLGEKDLKVTAAHELFHCFQFHVPLKISGNNWLLESTATWAEEYVYPDINSEHDYDKDIFPFLSKEFTDDSELREYGSYLWWFYIYQNSGKQPYEIKKSLFARKSTPNQEAMLMERPAWHAEHKEYALWDVNQGIAKFYKDKDDLPSWTPFPPSYQEGDITNELGWVEDINILPGGIKYYYYKVDKDVDKLRFDLKDLNAQEYTGVQVIYNVGGNEYIRDVSFQDELVFCRKRENEKVDVILFIVSNSDLTSPLGSDMLIEGFEECAPGWTGTITYSWSDSGEMSIPTFTGEAVGTYGERGRYFSREELVYDSKEDEFLVKSQADSYTYNYNQQAHFTNKPCGLIYQSNAESVNGGGQNQWEIDKNKLWESDAPTRLKGNGDGTYELNLKLWSGSLMSTDVTLSERRQCLGEGIVIPDQGEGGSETTSNQYDESESYGVIEWPYLKMQFRLSEDKKRLIQDGDAWFEYSDKKVPVSFSADFRYE